MTKKFSIGESNAGAQNHSFIVLAHRSVRRWFSMNALHIEWTRNIFFYYFFSLNIFLFSFVHLHKWYIASIVFTNRNFLIINWHIFFLFFAPFIFITLYDALLELFICLEGENCCALNYTKLRNKYSNVDTNLIYKKQEEMKRFCIYPTQSTKSLLMSIIWLFLVSQSQSQSKMPTSWMEIFHCNFCLFLLLAKTTSLSQK